MPANPRFFFSVATSSGRDFGSVGSVSVASGVAEVSSPGFLKLPFVSASPCLPLSGAAALAVVTPFVVVVAAGIPRFRRAAAMAFSTSAGSGTMGFACWFRFRDAFRGSSSSSSSSKSVESPSFCPCLLGIPRTGARAGEPGSSSSSESANRLRKSERLFGLPSSSSSESGANRDLKFSFDGFDGGGGAAGAVLMVIIPPPREDGAGCCEERSVVRFGPASTDPLRNDSRNFSPRPRPMNEEPEGDSDRRLNALPLPGVGDVGLSDAAAGSGGG